MKKLILGIVGIFCLQAMFIVYQAISPLPDMASITYIDRAGDEVLSSPGLDRLSAESEFADDDDIELASDDAVSQPERVFTARYVRRAPARAHYRRAGVAGVRINRTPTLP